MNNNIPRGTKIKLIRPRAEYGTICTILKLYDNLCGTPRYKVAVEGVKREGKAYPADFFEIVTLPTPKVGGKIL